MGQLLQALGLKPKSPGGPAPAAPLKPGGAGIGAAGISAVAATAAPPDAVEQGGGAKGGAPAVDKNKAAFATARDAVQKLVDGLNAHAQKTHIATQIGQAVAKLTDADTHAGKAEYGEATKRLVEARTIYTAAKKLADDWAEYSAKLGTAMALAMSFDFADAPDAMANANKVAAAADKLVKAVPPQFAAAALKLKEIVDDLKPQVQSLLTLAKTRLATVEKTDPKVKVFAKPEIDEGKAFIAQADKAFADKEWSLCRQNTIASIRVLGPAVRMCERRGLYEKQRTTTVAAITAVRTAAAVKDRAAALDALVTQADALAGHDARKFEDGVGVLQQAAKQSAMWSGLVTTIAAHARDRVSADAELAVLDKHAAAAKISKEREAARKLLADATSLATGAAAAADPAQAWNAALTAVTRARADMAVARKVADGLGTASAAEAAAAKPGDAAGMKAALDKLRADAKLASKAPHAAEAAAEFKRFDERAAAADEALTKKDPATAATALAAAAQALVAAKSIQAEHAQFASTLVSVEAQLKKLQASPRAAAIKARIDPVTQALTDAKAKDKAHAGTEAMIALRRANDAVAAATQADKDRASFDTDAAALAKRIAATKGAPEKAALEKSAADATKLADALTFADATRALKKIEVSLDKSKLEAMMKAKPDDPKISGVAAKMVENGGAATVDKMIQDVPDGGDARLVNALAQGRYGVKFTTGKPLPAVGAIPAGDEAKAMKAVCAMFAKIPQDVRNNPSIRGVSHTDVVGKAGGSHSFDDAKIRMKGRPNAIQQKFGAAQVNKDPKTNTFVPQLPAVIDPECKPVNNDVVEFLAFAAAHEVGHGVDDSKGFMKQFGKGPKYGGWITFGGSVQPLADAIGAAARFAAFYKTPAQKQYVLDKLMSKPVTAPAVAPASAEETALKAFDLWHSVATSANVYRRQGDCDFLKIGDYVYHEAYARNWVGYLHAARSKALTGYQFRAPGEWFAELYAGYRSGKLRPEHPAMEWLTKL